MRAQHSIQARYTTLGAELYNSLPLTYPWQPHPDWIFPHGWVVQFSPFTYPGQPHLEWIFPRGWVVQFSPFYLPWAAIFLRAELYNSLPYLPWAATSRVDFSSGLSLSIVVSTGTSCCLSSPTFRLRNYNVKVTIRSQWSNTQTITVKWFGT
jgi:hypothetical protein